MPRLRIKTVDAMTFRATAKLARLIILMPLVAGCAEEAEIPVYRLVPLETRDIVLSAEAAGTIEPVTTIEVKSGYGLDPQQEHRLLRRIAEQLSIDVGELSGEAEHRLIAEVEEALADALAGKDDG